MRILINDLMQYSDLPDDLKSPSLSDRYPNDGTLIVNFNIPSAYATFEIYDGVLSQPYFDSINGILSQPYYVDIDGVLSQPLSVAGADEFNCLGIGGTDATQITINDSITISTSDSRPFKPGLYTLGQNVRASQITIAHNGTYMGRIACGVCSCMAISPTREPGFYTNVKKRKSISGAVIQGSGGYGGRVIGVDFRYKIDKTIFEEMERAYVTQIMNGFPFFLDFENDNWLPMNKFYGETDNNLLFQSSLNGFKYSKRFEFKEAF